MTVTRRSRMWMFVARLALALLVGDVVGAAAVNPGPVTRLDADLSAICTVGGVIGGKHSPARSGDHSFCVFCLPLLHGGSAAPAGDVTLELPSGHSSQFHPAPQQGGHFFKFRLSFARAPPFA